MSNLIIPAKRMPQPHRQEIRMPPIEVPQALEEDLKMNSHLEPLFYVAIAKAVNKSLNHPDTALREVTESALKERIQACYKAMLVLRLELRYSLHKCFDILPQKFLEALVEGKKTEDLCERDAAGNAWNKGSEPRLVTMKSDEIEDIQETADGTEESPD